MRHKTCSMSVWGAVPPLKNGIRINAMAYYYYHYHYYYYYYLVNRFFLLILINRMIF